MPKVTSLTIFFPSLNDAKILPYLITKADNIGSGIASDYEILVINDGSTDDTKEVLEHLMTRFKSLRVVEHPKNRGYGAALISGFQNARKEWVFYTDGDGQYNLDDLPRLTHAVTINIDVVNGFKLYRSDNWIRKICGDVYNVFLKSRRVLPITDIDCDFRLIRASVVKDLKLHSKSGAICFELIEKLHKNGARFVEVGVKHYPRTFGHSQFFTIKNVFRTLKDDFLLFKRI